MASKSVKAPVHSKRVVYSVNEQLLLLIAKGPGKCPGFLLVSKSTFLPIFFAEFCGFSLASITMKDRSLLLLLLSVGLVGTWVYHLYDKSRYSLLSSQTAPAADTAAIIAAYKDSLSEAVSFSEKPSVSGTESIDSLKMQLDSRMKEINFLKRNAGNILKNKNISEADLKEARALIRNLRLRIDEMKEQNTSLEDERAALTRELAQLNIEIDSLQHNIQRLGTENQQLSKVISDASVFIASDLKLYAVRTGGKETPTTLARRAGKLVVSFNVQNNIKSYPNAELVIVILDPAGNVIMDDMWQSRSFDTRAEGVKNFTRKMRFEYIKGESKNLIFSISPEQFEKGTYQLIIYHNGVKIGQSTLGLS